MEILFDALTAQDVAARLAAIREHQAAVNSICLTVARMNGCAPTDSVQLNGAGTGVIVTPALVSPPLPSNEGGEPSEARFPGGATAEDLVEATKKIGNVFKDSALKL